MYNMLGGNNLPSHHKKKYLCLILKENLNFLNHTFMFFSYKKRQPKDDSFSIINIETSLF